MPRPNPSPSETDTSSVTTLCAYLTERTLAAKPDRSVSRRLDCPCQLSESTRDGDAQHVQSTDWNVAVLRRQQCRQRSGSTPVCSHEHAWKLIPLTRADAHQIPPTQFPSTTCSAISCSAASAPVAARHLLPSTAHRWRCVAPGRSKRCDSDSDARRRLTSRFRVAIHEGFVEQCHCEIRGNRSVVAHPSPSCATAQSKLDFAARSTITTVN